MKILHHIVTYRNGETGKLLTTERKNTVFTVMTLRDKDDSVIHHRENGKYLMTEDDHDLDVVAYMADVTMSLCIDE